MEDQSIKAVVIELDKAIEFLKTAQAITKDARLALIRADRVLGPSELSESVSSHIKQVEGLIKENGNCAMFIVATSALLKGDDNSDIEIVQSR